MHSTAGIKPEVRAAEILWALGSDTLWLLLFARRCPLEQRLHLDPHPQRAALTTAHHGERQSK